MAGKSDLSVLLDTDCYLRHIKYILRLVRYFYICFHVFVCLFVNE